ncbi:peptidyl-prolyl cis-trans isomerase-like 3, variant [Aphanomyces invadans]|uniref:Peptidyl-prolyl cis-trans isomerase n=1 Tax=Aphanomyces invadans TaxID=157072 RepID=A0A024UA48_9STRA|nr:peptidyl-prolyl cis-trans isomerase-like 3, variant [Aphanomyces invadans]ETW03090.1 peptidyl-prolyl cis-trans isomerase-like 3, variant [Aphanomyces invadans]|eukprot:XP_008868474.1 peptidyl-prolyl cis-trans isomerase-like 3, variant [Aphanomyces invadans]
MSVTLHTSLGDIKMEVFCDTAPRTAENFLALCASNSYDNTVFHRNMKGFMIQGGDPTGTGKGGESIWGGAIDDEFHPQNRVRSVPMMVASCRCLSPPCHSTTCEGLCPWPTAVRTQTSSSSSSRMRNSRT